MIDFVNNEINTLPPQQIASEKNTTKLPNDEKPPEKRWNKTMDRRTFLKTTFALMASTYMSRSGNLAHASKEKEAIQQSKEQFNYDYDVFDKIYMQGGQFDECPEIPHSQLWWFNETKASTDFSNERDYITSLLSTGKINNEPFLPILQCFYVFPILTKENSRISGEALRSYFQPKGSTFEKMIHKLGKQKGQIDISSSQDLNALLTTAGLNINQEELKRLISQQEFSVDNLTMFATAFFNSMPLHLLDYIERTDKADRTSSLHLRLTEPRYELNIKIKKELIKDLIGLSLIGINVPIPDVNGTIKWDQDVYIQYKTFNEKTSTGTISNPLSVDKKTVIFQNIKGASIQIPLSSKILGTLGTKTAQTVGLMDASLSEILNMANWYLAFNPDVYENQNGEIDNIYISAGLPNKKANIPINKMSIKEISYDGKTTPYVNFGAEIELFDSIKPFLYIHGKEPTQRMMRAAVIFSPMYLIQYELGTGVQESEYSDIKEKTTLDLSETRERIELNIQKMFEKVFDINIEKMLKGSSDKLTLRVKSGVSIQDVARLRNLIEITIGRKGKEASRGYIKAGLDDNDIKQLKILLEELKTGNLTNLNSI